MREAELEPPPARTARWSWIASFIRVDWPKGTHQPKALQLALAAITAISGSLVVCIVVATLGARVFAFSAKIPRFQFSSYSLPTIVVIAIACAVWPVATWVSSRGSRFFLCIITVATAMTIAADLWIFNRNQPGAIGAVAVAMHVGIAVVTYVSLVLVAPQWPRPEPRYFEDY